MKIFKAVAADGSVNDDGLILDDGNKVSYLSREGVVTKDFEDRRGEQVFPPLKSVVFVDPRAVRWGEHMVELINEHLLANGCTQLLWEDVDAVRAVCEREYVPQPDSEVPAPTAARSWHYLIDVPKDVKVIDAGGHVWTWTGTDFPLWLWSVPKGTMVRDRDADRFQVGPFIEFTGEVN